MINNRQGGRRGRGRGGVRPPNAGGGQDRGNRIDNRARGNAAQLHEKYKTLARDMQMQGDRVMTEYYLQFADHYFRVLSESRSRFEEQRRPQSGFDEFEDGDGDNEGAEASDDRFEDRPRQEQPRRERYEQRGERRDRDDRQGADRQAGERQGGERQEGERPRRYEQRGERRDETGQPLGEEAQAAEGQQGEERRPRRQRRDRPEREARNGYANGGEHDAGETSQIEVGLPAFLAEPAQSAPAVNGPANDVEAGAAEADAPRRRTRRPRKDGGEAAAVADS